MSERLQEVFRRAVATSTPTAGLDISGLQAEIDAAHSCAADAARGMLIQIFPGIDQEVIEWVLEANEGDLGRSIEALLEIGPTRDLLAARFLNQKGHRVYKTKTSSDGN